MAKISARGAQTVESIKSVIRYQNRNASTGPDEWVVKVTHTLCSDGRVLRKVDQGGYKVVGKLTKQPDHLASFRAYVARYEAARS